MKPIVRKNIPIIVGVIIGCLGGFLYWNFVDCSSGTCNITSVWYNSSLYGAVIGGLLGSTVKTK
jgi:hypothetical protein